MTHSKHGHSLSEDVKVLAGMAKRREFLKWLAVVAAVPAFSCDEATGTGSDDTTGGSTSDGTNTGSSSCQKIPEETAGPYPGDGSNGQNALVLSGIVRSDIRTSFAGASGTAEGVKLTVELTVVSTTDSCTPRAGYAVYLWHCDRDGNYSMYSSGVTDQNYLRGVQETDDAGTATFTTIFPACYSGRWPHIHFEVYPSVDAAGAYTNKIATSQIALPEDACDEVFTTTGYSKSISNLQQVSLTSDNVFSDGVTLQMPAVTGNASDGFVISMTVGIAD